MPKTVKQTSAAPRTRKSAHGRKDKAGTGRKGSQGNAPSAPRVIANSVFALTLSERPAIEVVEKMDVRRHADITSWDDDYLQMYHDLLAAFQNAVWLVKGEKTSFDPLASGLGTSTALSYVLKGFEHNIVPKGWSYNIDKDTSGYYFTLCKACDVSRYWHAFEIAPIVRFLKVTNPKLHDHFVLFIKCFMEETGIGGWWNGGMGYAEYMLQERIENYEDEGYDEEGDAYLDQLIECWVSYELTDVRAYQEMIQHAPFLLPDEIEKRLKKFNSKHPLVKWMKEACAFMKMPANINDFVYAEMEEDWGEGLRFDQQAAVIWDWNDAYTGMQEECIDAEVNGCGIIDPVLNWAVRRDTTRIDIQHMHTIASWPDKLGELHTSMRSVIEWIEKKGIQQKTTKVKQHAKRSNATIDVLV